jgi:polyisoprenoid-binding protein YceI
MRRRRPVPTAAPAAPARRHRVGRGRPRLAGALALVATLAAVGAAGAAAATLRVDAARSVLLLRTYRAGPAGRLAHDHAVRAAELRGTVEYDPAAPDAASVVVEVPTAALRVDEPADRRRLGLEGDLSADQRADVERAMRAPDQLDVARHPAIRFESTAIRREAEGRYVVSGRMTIRGVTRELTFPARVTLDAGTLVARATVSFLQSSFGYRPYSAFLGAVRNRDEVTLHVDLVAAP